MEHPCSRCGAAVDDTAPFCPSCQAPQIRFAARAEDASEFSVPTYQAPRIEQARVPPVEQYSIPAALRIANPSHTNSFVRAAAYAGIAGAFLSVLPFGFLFALPIAGSLAVFFYKKYTSNPVLEMGQGLRLGLLAGLFSFFGFVALMAVETLAFHAGAQLRQAMVSRIHQAQALNPDPQAQQVFAYFLTPQGLAVMMVVGLVFMGVVFVLLGGLGGTISAAFSRRKPPER